MGALVFRVEGQPAPQGSKVARPIYKGRGTARQFTGKVAVVESSKAGVKGWRAAVAIEARRALAGSPPIEGPVRVEVLFVLPRPKSHRRAGRFAHLLKEGAPVAPTTKPDVDKLLRSTLDALTEAGVWLDDSQVVEVRTRKAYSVYQPLVAAWQKVGALIEISEDHS